LLLVTLVACAATFGSAQAAEGPVDLLPDLDQVPPWEGDVVVQKESGSGQWQIRFSSKMYNYGAGRMFIHARRASTDTPTMGIAQVIDQSDGTTREVDVPGAVQYVTADHLHWHVLGLERYELRSNAEPDKVANDHKTGFCMADLSPDNCGWRDDQRLEVTEGIRRSTSSSNGFDYYAPYLEGQYINLDPVTTPDGIYSLTHRSNADHALLESNYDNNAASAAIKLRWTASGTPSYQFLKSCPDTETCTAEDPGDPPPSDPPPSDPPSDPPADPPADPGSDPQPQQPQPDPQPDPQQPGDTQAATDPQTPTDPQAFVPPLTVVQTPFGPKVVMNRTDASLLVRRAIRVKQKRNPHALTTTCKRNGSAGFWCRGSWSVGPRRWAGKVHVWYRVEGRKLAWYYTLNARHGKQRVVAQTARGGSRSAATGSIATRYLLCHAARRTSANRRLPVAPR
jgi:hypothetical protein